MFTTEASKQIDEHTTLIDMGMYGLGGLGAVYLIQGDKRRCLVDGGTRSAASRIVEVLKGLDAFPPDLILVTHAHPDHAQGIPILQREAAKKRREIAVMASPRCASLLGDATYHEIFDARPYERIEPVTPIREGDTVDLGGITLRIYEVPGHSEEHIAVLNEADRLLLVGDAIGLKLPGHVYLPPFLPPSWDADAFRSSIAKMREIDYEGLCLTHYGVLCGREAKEVLDEALAATGAWWRLFDAHADRLADPDSLFDAVRRHLRPGIPQVWDLPGAAGTEANVPAAVNPAAGEAYLRGFIAKLAMGYRMVAARSSPGS